MMRLLVVSQYFWPEVFLVNDLVAELVRRGHSVTVLTGKPNYPSGKLAPGYRRRGVQRETYADARVLRVPLLLRGRAGGLSLSLNYLSFAWAASWRLPWLLHKQPFDAIFIYGVSPLTAALPAILAKWIKRAPLTTWVQDLWPESVESSGLVRSRGALWLIKTMMRLIYRESDNILVQSRAFIPSIARLAPRACVRYFPNFAPDASGQDRLPAWISDLLRDDFCVTFGGNLGRAQALETIVEAATLLQSQARIRFVIAGSGVRADWLAREVARRAMSNVTLTGRLDAALMPELFRRSGALLLSLNGGKGLIDTIPSKLQAYFRAGRPIIGALAGEAARLVVDSGAALVVQPDDPRALAAAILQLRNTPLEQREAMGRRGRDYYTAHFEMHEAVGRLERILSDA